MIIDRNINNLGGNTRFRNLIDQEGSPTSVVTKTNQTGPNAPRLSETWDAKARQTDHEGDIARHGPKSYLMLLHIRLSFAARIWHKAMRNEPLVDLR